MRAFAFGVAATLLLAGCQRQAPAPVLSPHYVVGGGYQAGGTWFYPQEDFHYVATGLAVVQADRRGLTADGEAIDPGALTASHQTLQLPAVALVTNLETGLQVAVRINDRGPETPHRLIGLSRRAGELLGLQPGATAPVRVEVDEDLSLLLRQQLHGGPTLALVAAPRGAVQSESLAPPPGIVQSARGRGAPGAATATVSGLGPDPTVPARLPEVVRHVAVAPVRLSIVAGTFGQAGYAHQVAARLAGIGARVARTQEGRSTRFTVRAGPFADVASADMALDQALRAGVSDARIVAE